jgi:hypothetical protein
MFIQVIESHTSDAAGLRRFLAEERAAAMRDAIGFVGSTTAIAPDGTVATMARFESAELAAQNSSRPEQTAFFDRLTAFMDAEPTFHESSEVDTMLAGGSNDAGFVQFMIGTATDKARARSAGSEPPQEFRDARPDVIGSTTVWDGDWWCQVVYFTSEAEAREGEKGFDAMPDDDKARMADMMSALGEPRFIDGPDPILV